MSAPDRPTREEVDAALADADRAPRVAVVEDTPHHEGTRSGRGRRNPLDVLAAEVRALRAEQDDARAGKRDRARWASWLDQSADEADDLSDAERLGLRVAATHLLDVEVAARVSTIDLDADAIRDLYGRLWAKVESGRAVQVARTPQPADDSAVHAEACRVIREAWAALPSSVAQLARAEGATLAGCIAAIPAPLPAVPDGEDEPDWHNMRERLHTEIGAIVGVTPREERTGDADGDLIEMVRRAVWAPSPATAPDGEDVPDLLGALQRSLVDAKRKRTTDAGEDVPCGSCGHDADHSGGECMWFDDVLSNGEHVQVSCRCDGSPNPDTDPDDPLGEDVPARLDAAADALAPFDSSKDSSARQAERHLRRAADWLNATSPDARAAVAAALARPTGDVR